MAPNAIDQQMNLLHDTSVGLKDMTQTNGVRVDQIGQVQNAQGAMYQQQLQEQQLAEFLKASPFSTVGQPGDNTNQRIVVLPPKTVIMMPPVSDAANAKYNECLSNSWWTKSIAPAPKFEHADSRLVVPRNGITTPDASKANPTVHVPNFPIQFDPMVGYREFLS
jgi:hypothetical protein